MNKQAYNDQTINEYLLGSLPEAEAERFDELSFTDDEFAGALKAAEKELVDAYVQGELSGQALEQFKSHYLASPLRRERVQFAQAFHLLAERKMAAQVAEVRAERPAGSEAKRKGSGWLSALSVLAPRRTAWQWGTAFAALALLVLGGWLAFENARLRGQVSETQARRDALGRREQELQKELEGQRAAGAADQQELARVREERERLEQELRRQEAREQQRLAGERRAPAGGRPAPTSGVSIASFVLAPQMRGTGQIQTVSVPADTDGVAMRLELEPNDYTAYQVALLDQPDNRTLWRSRRLKARAAGEGQALGVSFSAGLLKPGAVYVLRVTGVSTGGASDTVGDYPFRVVR